jgi:hypothetical protein
MISRFASYSFYWWEKNELTGKNVNFLDGYCDYIRNVKITKVKLFNQRQNQSLNKNERYCENMNLNSPIKNKRVG